MNLMVLLSLPAQLCYCRGGGLCLELRMDDLSQQHSLKGIQVSEYQSLR